MNLKNRSLIGVVILIGLLCLTPETLSQSEQLGAVRYTAPKGWTKSAKEHAVVFNQVDEVGNKFCFITLYAVSQSTGTPAGDFAREWNIRLVTPWGAAANPKTETNLADGWTAVAGGAPIDFNGNKAFALLTVMSGFGKVVSVLGVLNNDSYVADLTAFVEHLDIDKSKTTPSPATSTSSPALQFDDYGHLLIPAPTRQLTSADIVGEWGESDGINERYVDRYTGAYAGADSLHYKSKMTFSSDGRYYDDFYAIQNGKLIKEKSAGSVRINGSVLLIKDTNLRKYVIRGWLELPNMTILEVCGPWYGDDEIPQEIFNNPRQGANLDKKWVRMK
jgi:hypothetical protein